MLETFLWLKNSFQPFLFLILATLLCSIQAAKNLTKKYNEAKKKLDGKTGDLDDVIRRINELDKKAGDAVVNVNVKLNILNGKMEWMLKIYKSFHVLY